LLVFTGVPIYFLWSHKEAQNSQKQT